MISLITLKTLATSKLGQYLIGAVAIILVFTFIFKSIYSKGYNTAKKEDEIAYMQQLNEALKSQVVKQQEAIKNAVEVAKKEKDIEVKWKEKKVYVDRMVEKTVYKECVMPEEDKKTFNEAWDSIK